MGTFLFPQAACVSLGDLELVPVAQEESGDNTTTTEVKCEVGRGPISLKYFSTIRYYLLANTAIIAGLHERATLPEATGRCKRLD